MRNERSAQGFMHSWGVVAFHQGAAMLYSIRVFRDHAQREESSQTIKGGRADYLRQVLFLHPSFFL